MLRIIGDIPAEVNHLLARLHDHMARCTIENPHIDHRVRRLGLERHVRELRTVGYTVVDEAITGALAEQIRGRLEESGATTATDLLTRDRLFEEIALHPTANTLVQSILGLDATLEAMTGGHPLDTYDEPLPTPADTRPDDDPAFVVATWILADDTVEAPPESNSPDGPDRPPATGALVVHVVPRRRPVHAPTLLELTYARTGFGRSTLSQSISAEQLRRNPPAFHTLVGRTDRVPFATGTSQPAHG